MKVLHIIDSGGLYGAEKMLLALVVEQMADGFEPCVCSIGVPGEQEKPLERELRTHGVECWPLRMRKGLNLLGGWSMVREARRRGFKMLHTHGYKGNILLAALPRSLRPIPWVVTTHGWSLPGSSLRTRLYRWLDGRAIGAADHIVAVSESMLSLGPFARRRVASKASVIPNAVRRPRPTGQTDDKIADFCGQSVTAAIVGRLDPIKGHDPLLQAIAAVVARGVDLRLLVLGDGPLREPLRGRVRALGIEDRVLLAGFREDVADCLSVVDLLVMPSLSEGLPIALLEAIGVGVPVIASTVGGVPEVIRKSRAGVLVPPGDIEALASALESMTTDDALRESYRDGLVNAAAPLFDVSSMARAYSGVYYGGVAA